MGWSRHHDGGRRYHHGNLREALIEAALRLIAEKGPGGFTIAEAARVAGVSPAAPTALPRRAGSAADARLLGAARSCASVGRRSP
jgi:hypothetical protein